MTTLIRMDIWGTWSDWQLGSMAGREACRTARSGTTAPRIRDFDPSCTNDYISGYMSGWQDEAVPVHVMASTGPRSFYVAR